MYSYYILQANRVFPMNRVRTGRLIQHRWKRVVTQSRSLDSQEREKTAKRSASYHKHVNV